jgi:hypothetical protein
MDLDDQGLKMFRKFMALILSINRYQNPGVNPCHSLTVVEFGFEHADSWEDCHGKPSTIRCFLLSCVVVNVLLGEFSFGSDD